MATTKTQATKAQGAKSKKVQKKKAKKIVGGKGLAFVRAVFNNTIIGIADIEGNIIASGSPGAVGFKGSRKSTPFAATKAAETVAAKAIEAGVREVQVFVNGLGVGRNAAIKGLRGAGLKINMITDKTGIPHGGPTPRKMPRGS